MLLDGCGPRSSGLLMIFVSTNLCQIGPNQLLEQPELTHPISRLQSSYTFQPRSLDELDAVYTSKAFEAMSLTQLGSHR